MLNLYGLHGRKVDLNEILEAKEERAGIKSQLRMRYNTPVVSMAINSPGGIKYSDEVVDLLYHSVELVRKEIRQLSYTILEERVYHSCAGPWAVMAVTGSAVAMKEMMILLEEKLPYGRLLDIDVLNREGEQITRSLMGRKARNCLVCSNQAVLCMREAAHSSDEISRATRRYLTIHQALKTKKWPCEVEMIASTAIEAMLTETACSPSPGLVDRFNQGAHKDMDFFTFIKSSSALSCAMYRFALTGWEHNDSPAAMLPVLRVIGQEAETAMFQATNGVNTQKGLLFALGIVTAAVAAVTRHNPQINDTAVFAEVASICQGIVGRELEILECEKPIRPLTAGECLYLEYKVTGIRGELERGLPTVKERGLPYLRIALERKAGLNDALLHALIAIMSIAEDTTILSRHNRQTLVAVQTDALNILNQGGALTEEGKQRIADLDREYIRRWISPGGSADLLAVTYFIHTITQRLTKGCLGPL